MATHDIHAPKIKIESEDDSLVQMIFLFISGCILRFHVKFPGYKMSEKQRQPQNW